MDGCLCACECNAYVDAGRGQHGVQYMQESLLVGKEAILVEGGRVPPGIWQGDLAVHNLVTV
jgi:hypothetical protein